MNPQSLATDEGLRSALEAVSHPTGPEAEWLSRLAETIRWVRSADEAMRSTRDFQWRLWEDNHIAAIGPGSPPVGEALDDEAFRRWLAQRSTALLPTPPAERLLFLTALYKDLTERLSRYTSLEKVPILKVFRVIAAMYPESMTTLASVGRLGKLSRAMGCGRRLDLVERHIWVCERIEGLLGHPGSEAAVLAERMSRPWALYEKFVLSSDELTATDNGDASLLMPFLAARRRRGLTATRGSFLGVLTTLEEVRARDGITRDELLDLLQASAPDVKRSTLATNVNVLQGELAVIRAENGRYELTPRGEDVLVTQDPSILGEWLLTRVLGVDKALVFLRDSGPSAPADLGACRKTVIAAQTGKAGSLREPVDRLEVNGTELSGRLQPLW